MQRDTIDMRYIRDGRETGKRKEEDPFTGVLSNYL